MRSSRTLRLPVAILLTLAACGRPAPQKSVIPTTPQPPGPVPTYKPQTALVDPSPQRSTLAGGTPQAPISAPSPQKPFYGPGTTSPDEKAQLEAQKRAKEEKAAANKPLSDGDVLAILGGMSAADLELATIARKNGMSREVKDYAAMVTTHENASRDKIAGVVDRTKIMPTASYVSDEMGNDASSTASELRAKKGVELDQAYLDAQVREGRDRLMVIDQRLLPSASNGEVRAAVTAKRAVVVEHLAKAEDLSKKTRK